MTTLRNSRGRGAILAGAVVAALVLGACSSPGAEQSGNASGGEDQTPSDPNSYSLSEGTDGKTAFVIVTNPNGGETLTYTEESGIKLIEEKEGEFTYAFKDMDGDGVLSPWEDWRLDSSARAADLAPKLSKEQISGLMLFSSHQSTPQDGLTDDQKEFLSESRVRAVLNAAPNNVRDNVRWVNELEAYVETLRTADEPYIPAYFSSDPRSTPVENQVMFAEDGSTISQWPDNLGLSAIADPERTEEMAYTQSQEYRALGIQVALGPIVDLATDPRWPRNYGGWGENPELASEMGAAYVAGMQATRDEDGNDTGFGLESVQTTIKHFPGDGAAEGGRESHQFQGAYAVYPGNNQGEALSVFTNANDAAAMMLSYSSHVGADGGPAFGDSRWATAYNKDLINMAREDAGFEGVIMTDWGVTDRESADGIREGKTWGVDTEWVRDINEQHYRIISAGADMFGGNNNIAPVLAAYDLWDEAFAAGEEDVDAATRWATTGGRVLNMIFRAGAYENPFLDLDHSTEIAGSADKMELGREAQMDSVVMLKNDMDVVECGAAEDSYKDKKVYIPQTYAVSIPSRSGETEYSEGPTLDLELAEKYFGEVVTDEVEYEADGTTVKSYTAPDLSDVDYVIVGMRPPFNGGVAQGYDPVEGEYIPVSLQYGEYVADGDNVRKTSIAGDMLPDGTQENRSYFGKQARISNAADKDAFDRAVAAVEATGKDIPVITIVKIQSGYNAFAIAAPIPAEYEPQSDALFIGYSVTQEAMLKVALGLHDPAGKLPIGLPKDMDAVEAQYEDVPMDQDLYVDSAGNTYGFGFGLGCGGKVLND